MGDSFQQQIPVLPVVIPLGVVIFALLLWRLKAKRIFSVPRAMVAAALGIYAAGIVGNTVFPIYIEPITSTFNPFTETDEWMTGVVLIPFADYEWGDAVQNILVFVPLGILIALLLTRPSWWKVLLAVAGTSLAIELTQLTVSDFFGGGHVADTSDLVSNVAGGMLGYALLALLSRIPWFARFAEQFRWASTAQTAPSSPETAQVTARVGSPSRTR